MMPGLFVLPFLVHSANSLLYTTALLEPKLKLNPAISASSNWLGVWSLASRSHEGRPQQLSSVLPVDALTLTKLLVWWDTGSPPVRSPLYVCTVPLTRPGRVIIEATVWRDTARSNLCL